mmetsp:Transcript_89659/g.148573  ORF Transcript_89659/g.148573 Transcript_89659/m.148573 type:complete len:389 (+) Transcript_89659:96-1262(+)
MRMPDPTRSSDHYLRSILRPSKVSNHIVLHQDDAIFQPEELMMPSLGGAAEQPELEGTAVSGGCHLWCVPHGQTDCYGGQRRLVSGVQPPAPSMASEQDQEGDMFESARLGVALEQLLIERTSRGAASLLRPAQRRPELMLRGPSGAPPPPCRKSAGIRGPRASPPAQWQSPQDRGLSMYDEMDSPVMREKPVTPRPPPRRFSPERGSFIEQGCTPEPHSDWFGTVFAGRTTATPRLGSSAEPSAARAAVKTTSRCRETSADDVFTDVLGVKGRRRSMLGEFALDEPTVREPHAVALCRLPKWLDPSVRGSPGSVFQTRSFAEQKANTAHLGGAHADGPGRGAWRTANPGRRCRSASVSSASNGMSQAELQAVLQRMPLPNVVADPLQ